MKENNPSAKKDQKTAMLRESIVEYERRAIIFLSFLTAVITIVSSDKQLRESKYGPHVDTAMGLAVMSTSLLFYFRRHALETQITQSSPIKPLDIERRRADIQLELESIIRQRKKILQELASHKGNLPLYSIFTALAYALMAGTIYEGLTGFNAQWRCLLASIFGGAFLSSSIHLNREMKALTDKLAHLEQRIEDLNRLLPFRMKMNLPGERKTPRDIKVSSYQQAQVMATVPEKKPLPVSPKPAANSEHSVLTDAAKFPLPVEKPDSLPAPKKVSAELPLPEEKTIRKSLKRYKQPSKVSKAREAAELFAAAKARKEQKAKEKAQQALAAEQKAKQAEQTKLERQLTGKQKNQGQEKRDKTHIAKIKPSAARKTRQCVAKFEALAEVCFLQDEPAEIEPNPPIASMPTEKQFPWKLFNKKEYKSPEEAAVLPTQEKAELQAIEQDLAQIKAEINSSPQGELRLQIAQTQQQIGQLTEALQEKRAELTKLTSVAQQHVAFAQLHAQANPRHKAELKRLDTIFRMALIGLADLFLTPAQQENGAIWRKHLSWVAADQGFTSAAQDLAPLAAEYKLAKLDLPAIERTYRGELFKLMQKFFKLKDKFNLATMDEPFQALKRQHAVYRQQQLLYQPYGMPPAGSSAQDLMRQKVLNMQGRLHDAYLEHMLGLLELFIDTMKTYGAKISQDFDIRTLMVEQLNKVQSTFDQVERYCHEYGQAGYAAVNKALAENQAAVVKLETALKQIEADLSQLQLNLSSLQKQLSATINPEISTSPPPYPHSSNLYGSFYLPTGSRPQPNPPPEPKPYSEPAISFIK